MNVLFTRDQFPGAYFSSDCCNLIHLATFLVDLILRRLLSVLIDLIATCPSHSVKAGLLWSINAMHLPM